MAELTLQEARRILADCDTSDPARAIAAVAMVLRFEGIADEKLLPIAGQLESVADGLRTAGVAVPAPARYPEHTAFCCGSAHNCRQPEKSCAMRGDVLGREHERGRRCRTSC